MLIALRTRKEGGKARERGMSYARFSKLRPVNDLESSLVSLIIKTSCD